MGNSILSGALITRNKKKEKGKSNSQNKFEILASRIMRSKEGRGYIRQQEVEEERKKVKYFRC